MSEEFTLIRCGCGRAFGKKKQSKVGCPRCYSVDSLTTISTFTNPMALAEAVSKANLPEELRKEFAKKAKKEVGRSIENSPKDLGGADLIRSILDSSQDENGTITLQSVRDTLEREGLDRPSAEYIIGNAEQQGLLLRPTNESWKLLG